MVRHTIKNNNVTVNTIEKGLEFYLSITGDGEVQLNAAGQNGIDWYVLKIANNGKLSLAECLADDLGLQVDDEGAIEFNENTY